MRMIVMIATVSVLMVAAALLRVEWPRGVPGDGVIWLYLGGMAALALVWTPIVRARSAGRVERFAAAAVALVMFSYLLLLGFPLDGIARGFAFLAIVAGLLLGTPWLVVKNVRQIAKLIERSIEGLFPDEYDSPELRPFEGGSVRRVSCDDVRAGGLPADLDPKCRALAAAVCQVVSDDDGGGRFSATFAVGEDPFSGYETPYKFQCVLASSAHDARLIINTTPMLDGATVLVQFGDGAECVRLQRLGAVADQNAEQVVSEVKRICARWIRGDYATRIRPS
jgi:hypothetical protein